MGKSELLGGYHSGIVTKNAFLEYHGSIAGKGSNKKGSQAGDDDASSLASASTLSSVADLGFDDTSAIEDDPFEAAIDALYEKRCAHTTWMHVTFATLSSHNFTSVQS